MQSLAWNWKSLMEHYTVCSCSKQNLIHNVKVQLWEAGMGRAVNSDMFLWIGWIDLGSGSWILQILKHIKRHMIFHAYLNTIICITCFLRNNFCKLKKIELSCKIYIAFLLMIVIWIEIFFSFWGIFPLDPNIYVL